MEISLLIFFVAGAAGALAKDIIQDSELKLPKVSEGKIQLGFLGGMATGGLAGYLVDGQFSTAFMAGYVGTSIIENLINKEKHIDVPLKEINEVIIKKIAKEEEVDPDLAVRVAKCESGLNEKAINTNTDGSRDRGLFQINEKWHPEISDEEAFNPILATKFFCKAFKGGNLSWWNATKKCWDV